MKLRLIYLLITFLLNVAYSQDREFSHPIFEVKGAENSTLEPSSSSSESHNFQIIATLGEIQIIFQCDKSRMTLTQLDKLPFLEESFWQIFDSRKQALIKPFIMPLALLVSIDAAVFALGSYFFHFPPASLIDCCCHQDPNRRIVVLTTSVAMSVVTTGLGVTLGLMLKSLTSNSKDNYRDERAWIKKEIARTLENEDLQEVCSIS